MRRRRDAALASVSLIALAGFVWISRRVRARAFERLDHAALRRIRAVRRPRLNSVVRDVTSLGGLPLIGLAHLGAAITLRHSRPALAQLGIGALGGAAAEVTLKRHFARPRPPRLPPFEYVQSWSYPSGHSIAASSLYLTLAFAATRHSSTSERVAAIMVAGVLAAAVGASRVYLGVHHPSDVIAGLAAGTAWACLLEAIFEARGTYDERVPKAADATALAATADAMFP